MATVEVPWVVLALGGLLLLVSWVAFVRVTLQLWDAFRLVEQALSAGRLWRQRAHKSGWRDDRYDPLKDAEEARR